MGNANVVGECSQVSYHVEIGERVYSFETECFIVEYGQRCADDHHISLIITGQKDNAPKCKYEYTI